MPFKKERKKAKKAERAKKVKKDNSFWKRLWQVLKNT